MADMATVLSVSGKAYARNADGEMRELKVGSVLSEGETVVTPEGGRVELSMADDSLLIIGEPGELLITRDLVAETAAGADESAMDDETVDQVLAALERGEDLGDVLEPTAAGVSGGEGGEGSSFIRLARIVEETSEFSGIAGSQGEESEVLEDDFIHPVDAVDDEAETPEDVPVTIDVEANDQFIEGSIVTAVTQPANGTVVINDDDTVTYTPNPGFTGQDTFTYTATTPDGNNQDTAVVTVDVIPETEEPPVPQDNEPKPELPQISVGDDTVVEGGVAEITITLSKPWSEPVTVSFATADNSAIAPGDYGSAGGTVTFQPGETSITVNVVTNIDSEVEGTETLDVILSAPVNGTIADGSGEVTILDGTEPPQPPEVPELPDPPEPPVDENLPPDAIDDPAQTTVNTPVDILVLSNDSDPDGDQIEVTGFSQPGNGTVVLNPDGSFTYTPNENFDGEDSFTYTISDGELTDTATVTVAVSDNPVDLPDPAPQARGIQRVLDEALLPGGTAFSGGDDNARDGSFDVVSLDGLSSLTVNGVELLDGDGDLLPGTEVTDAGGYVRVTFTGMSLDDATGTYTVEYTATLVKPFEHDPGSDTAGVDFVITAVDADGDVAGPVTRSATIADDQPIANADNNGLVAGDSLAEGNVLLGDAAGGVADEPGADGAAVTAISFTGQDGVAETLSVIEGGVTIAGDYGDLTIHPGGSYSYQLNAVGEAALIELSGEESLQEQFTYNLNDGDDDAADATLTITLSGDNDPPQSQPLADQQSQDADAVAGVDISGAFDDPDGDPLTFSAVGLPDGLEINEDGIISGTVDNSASQGGSGGVYEVTVTARDPFGSETSQSFDWTVTNPAPDFVDENSSPLVEDTYVFTVAEGAAVDSAVGTAPASDPDGDTPLSYSITGGNDKGLFAIDASTGAITVAQSPDDANGDLGVHELTIRVDDGEGGIDTGTVLITVTDVNEPPGGSTLPSQSDQDADEVAGVDLSGYFSDGDTPPDALTFEASGLPAGLSMSSAGVISGTIDNSASQGGVGGVYTVTVTATDSGGLSASEQFSWTVTNPAPDAVDDTETVDEDSSINIDVLANDSDPDADDINVVSITQPANGAAVLEADGTVTYTPDANFSGDDSFTYTIEDGEGGSDTATVYLTVDPSAKPAITATTDALVDEDDLAQGIHNTDSPQDDTANPNGTIEFDVGGDGLKNIALSSSTTGITTLDGAAVRFFWDESAGELIGYTGDVEPDAPGFNAGDRVVSVTLGTPSVSEDGTGSVGYSVELFRPVTHSGTDEDATNVSFTVGVVVTDNDDDSTGGDDTFEVEIDDDMPIAFTTDAASVVDASGIAVTENLNFYVADGADGDGTVLFAGEPGSDPVRAFDASGNPLSFDTEPLYVYGAGTDTLVIKTLGASDADAAFIIEISGDQYTVTPLNGIISNGTELSDAQFDNISGGNNQAVYLTDPFSTDGSELDVILSAFDFNSEQNTVNTSNGLIGIGAGKEIAYEGGGGDVLTMEFVTLTDDANPGAGSTPQRVNNLHLPVQYKGGGISQVSFRVDYFLAGALLGSETKVVADGSNSSITGAGADLQWDGGFDKVVITAVDQGSKNAFNIGGFSLTQLNEGEDIVFNANIVGTDRDGDSVESGISVAIDAPAVETAVDTLSVSTPEALTQEAVSPPVAPDDPITVGDDTLVAQAGQADVFAWNPGNLGGDDTIQNFGTVEGDRDVIDLRDLIPEDADVSQYLQVESVSLGETVSTVITVDADGEGRFNGGGIDQTITIEGVDLTGGYSDVADIVRHMVNSEHLDI